jgi:DNA-directed RNA polymerase subunit RPC12/RpoP
MSRACPLCAHGRLTRVRRRVWMRRVPGSRLYLCLGCGQLFLFTYDPGKLPGPADHCRLYPLPRLAK